MSELPEKMYGVLLVGHGGPEMLQFRDDIPMPCPGTNDVLVRISAAGVNNTDINTRTAWYSKSDHKDDDASWSGQALNFPLIQGADVCGTIVSVGENVEIGRIGERVLIEPCIREAHNSSLDKPWYLGSECDEGFAEYLVVASRHAYAVNTTYEDYELASFPCSYSTAENMLTRSQVTAGDRVLITGASSGVGSAAIQIAKADTLRKLGADQTIGRQDDFVEFLGKDSIDVVIDLVAGQKWPSLLDILHSGGRYAVAGAIGGSIVELDVRTLYLKDLSFFGCTVLEPEVFGNLIAHIENGRVKPLVAETYPLKEIKIAQASFENRSHIRKIVLKLMD